MLSRWGHGSPAIEGRGGGGDSDESCLSRVLLAMSDGAGSKGRVPEEKED
jgi:hypothetical protein